MLLQFLSQRRCLIPAEAHKAVNGTRSQRNGQCLQKVADVGIRKDDRLFLSYSFSTQTATAAWAKTLAYLFSFSAGFYSNKAQNML